MWKYIIKYLGNIFIYIIFDCLDPSGMLIDKFCDIKNFLFVK